MTSLVEHSKQCGGQRPLIPPRGDPAVVRAERGAEGMLRRVEPAAAEIKSDPSRHLANKIPLGLHGIESLGEDRLIRPADGGAAFSDEIHDGGAERREPFRETPPAGPRLVVVEQGVVRIQVGPLAGRLLPLEREHPHEMRPERGPRR